MHRIDQGTIKTALSSMRVASVLCIAVMGVSSNGATRAQSFAEIVFEFKTRQPIVSVRVNDGPVVPFVVDTGASIHVLDREVAKAAAVAAGSSVQMSGGGRAPVDAQFVDGLTLEAGKHVWSAQRAAVASLGYPDSKHFAGLLGAPILMRYTVQFAFAERTLRLFEPSAYKAPAGATLVPFELQENLPIVRATIDAGNGPIEARLMVDTGASTFIDLNRPFVDAHKLVDIMPDRTAADRPAALGGSAPFLYGTARRVTFAGIEFDKPRLGLSRAETGSSSRPGRDGIIGNALLERFVVAVDYSRRVLVLGHP